MADPKYSKNDEALETLLLLDGEIFPMEKVSPYEYESASHLLEDFWAAVEYIIEEG